MANLGCGKMWARRMCAVCLKHVDFRFRLRRTFGWRGSRCNSVMRGRRGVSRSGRRITRRSAAMMMPCRCRRGWNGRVSFCRIAGKRKAMKTGIWNTLEARAEGQPPAAVLVEWRRLAGSDFEALGGFLRMTQRRAGDYPCLAELRCGFRVELIELDDDRWLARCECEMSGCDAARLTTDDLWIHELDALRFGNTVAGALGFEAAPAAGLITAAPNVWPAGIHKETRSPVFLFFCPDQGRMLANLEGLAANCGEPFIVLAPTARARSEVVGNFLQRERCAFIPL